MALCPLISNDALGHAKKRLSDNQKIENFHVKTDVCGREFFEVVKGNKTEFFTVPVYCNNRACDKSGCKEHRAYLFYKSHSTQSQCVTLSMHKPKTWVFTGWVIKLSDMTSSELREFSRHKMSLLFRILQNRKYGAVTGFSIHMEFKFHPDGTVYLHFHVVTGGLKDFHRVRKKWGRVIVYEKAISPKAVSEYISKYASKTPSFLGSEFLQEFYHLLVYKTLMHRFSVTRKDAEKNSSVVPLSPSGCYAVSSLIAEMKMENWKTSYLNPNCKEMEYHPLLEPPLKLPDFTKPLFEKKPDEIQITTHEKVEPDPNYKWVSIEEISKQKPDFEITIEHVVPVVKTEKKVVKPETVVKGSIKHKMQWKTKHPSKLKHYSSGMYKKYKMEVLEEK